MPETPGSRTALEIEAEIRALEARLTTLHEELAEATAGAPASIEASAADAAEETSGRIRVVVADDEPDIRDLVGTIVTTQADLELVGVASDAKEAVEKVLEHKPHVAVLDLSMPGGGGVWAAHQILRALPETRVVCFTAHDTPEAQFDVMRAGAVGFLLKGVSHDEILRTIRNAATSPPGRPQG